MAKGTIRSRKVYEDGEVIDFDPIYWMYEGEIADSEQDSDDIKIEFSRDDLLKWLKMSFATGQFPVKWCLKAAEQGEVDAQNNLGAVYENGDGVPQDYAEAVRWYREAANQGYALAQFNLGFLYYEGKVELSEGMGLSFVVVFSNALPLAVGSKYDFRELGVYLGNVGLDHSISR